MAKNMKSYQQPTHEEISAVARQIYEREGRPEGRAMQHWLQAEKQLISERKAAAGNAQAKPAAMPKAQAPAVAAPAASTTRPAGWQSSGRQDLHRN